MTHKNREEWDEMIEHVWYDMFDQGSTGHLSDEAQAAYNLFVLLSRLFGNSSK